MQARQGGEREPDRGVASTAELIPVSATRPKAAGAVEQSLG